MESLFDRWWRRNHDGYVATHLMQRCFKGGFWAGLRLGLIAAVAVVVVSLAGCKDSYRYPCQNPDNFHAEACQKPKCQFTQQCPEYLVAPILEKQINAVQPAQQPASSASSDR